MFLAPSITARLQRTKIPPNRGQLFSTNMASNEAFPPPIPWDSKPKVVQPSSNIMWKNAVYYPSWRVYRGDTPATMNYSCISHVFYAFAHLEPDGGVLVSLTHVAQRSLVDMSIVER